MAHFIEQIHIRVGQDRELFKKINELMALYPDRFDSQSQVCRAAINYMHRELTKQKVSTDGTERDRGRIQFFR